MNELLSDENRGGRTFKLSGISLLEMMEICSNMYLTHTLTVQILGCYEDLSETDDSSVISENLLFAFPPFVGRLMQIH